MKRLTTDNPKDNLEAALNLFYIKDFETWVRGGGPGPKYADVSLFEFIRKAVKTNFPDMELPKDDDNLSFAMAEWLMDGYETVEGVIALLYTAAWAYAELRYHLSAYEDTGLEPDEIKELIFRFEKCRVIRAALCDPTGQPIADPEHIRDLIKAEQDGRLVVWGRCDYCYYDDDHSHCPDGADSLECGVECFGCVCCECEKGSRFKAALAGKGGDG